MSFKPFYTDWKLSPYTGLTRESWIEAAIFMLEGIFKHIKDIDSPVIVPRRETEITYPHKNASPEIREQQRRAEIFEGLTRSFFIAAPLIHIEPNVKVCGIPLREYYKHQVLRICTSDDDFCAGTYEALQEITNHTDPFKHFQQTVETCALVICLWTCRNELWAAYTKEEKDIIAAFLSSFAHANTVPQNWRLFNMLDLAFLNNEGYPIDREIMLDHAQAILDYYAGDGWYRDGQSFDCYSCWAFNFYAPLWCQWYGYENEPFIAQKFEENSNRLMATYADFFDSDGWTNMWGRSSIYRFAAVSAFDGNMLLRNSTVNCGLARRISSGALMQFLGREDFCVDGVPTMGFYRQFKPLVQGYSCAESPFWMGKAFMCLHLPENHPFWTERENNGSWDSLGENEVKETCLNGPALCFSNHKVNGETILRTGKIAKEQNDIHGMWNYSKLCYNTKYPWESTPEIQDADCVLNKGQLESQQYVINDVTEGYSSLANLTYWSGMRDGVLYRKQIFDYRTDTELSWRQQIMLADFPVPYGIMRVDKLRLYRRPIMLTLGSYGFPDNGTQARVLEREGAKAVVLKGKDACGRERQMAMTIYSGWSELDIIHSKGTNPDSEGSIVIFAKAELKKQYGGYEPYIFVSQVITRDDGIDLSEEDIFGIERISFADKAQCGAYGDIAVKLKNGVNRTIGYDAIEGSLML